MKPLGVAEVGLSTLWQAACHIVVELAQGRDLRGLTCISQPAERPLMRLAHRIANLVGEFLFRPRRLAARAVLMDEQRESELGRQAEAMHHRGRGRVRSVVPALPRDCQTR